MDLDFELGGQQRGHVGERSQQALRHIGKALEGCFASRAVNAVAGLSQYPFVQLPGRGIRATVGSCP